MTKKGQKESTQSSPSFSIIIIFILFIIAGISSLSQLPVQLNPDYTLPTIRVRFSWHNASPRGLEQEVTSVLEGALNTINGIEKMEKIRAITGCEFGNNFLSVKNTKSNMLNNILYSEKLHK